VSSWDLAEQCRVLLFHIETKHALSLQIYPDCRVAGNQVICYTLRSRSIRYSSGFDNSSQLNEIYNCNQLFYPYLNCFYSPFNTSFTTTTLSCRCSMYRFENYPWRSFPEGQPLLSIRVTQRVSSLDLRSLF